MIDMRMKDKILYLVEQGLTNTQIAKKLSIEPQHVATTRYRAKQQREVLQKIPELSILVPPRPEDQFPEDSKEYQDAIRIAQEAEHLRQHTPLKEIRLLASKCQGLVPGEVIDTVVAWADMRENEEEEEN